MKHAYEVVSKAIKLAGGLAPAGRAAGDYLSSPAGDRLGFSEAVVLVNAGAVTGGPTAFSIDVTLEHSADGSSGWTTYATSTAVVSAANSAAFAAFDLEGAKQFVRAKLTVNFTGGTTPSVIVGAEVLLGGSQKIPA
ncbi:MAG: hypothetical protein KatS3mg054_0110 [Chloroflexus sp.]|nr:MAG: hypothetical protein KatS3mg054_0110 [Chloroflexus sp.]